MYPHIHLLSRLTSGSTPCYSCSVTVGILVAQVINYFTQFYEWGWRLSLGLAVVPGLMVMLGCCFVPETANSLVERGHYQQALINLQKIRGRKGGFALSPINLASA
jgi:hypothetical protein